MPVKTENEGQPHHQVSDSAKTGTPPTGTAQKVEVVNSTTKVAPLDASQPNPAANDAVPQESPPEGKPVEPLPEPRQERQPGIFYMVCSNQHTMYRRKFDKKEVTEKKPLSTHNCATCGQNLTVLGQDYYECDESFKIKEEGKDAEGNATEGKNLLCDY